MSPSTTPANVPAGGMSVPGYTLVRRIGSGGQAIVYEAVQNSLERPVALKVLNPVYSTDEEFTRRFLNEGRILANLGHSNVITIHDIGVAGELHYLSMELVEGGDLRRRIRAGLAPATVIDYLVIIADCLASAHERNVVHRDIKPANVLFRRDGTLLLTDFGIAKLLDTEELTVAGTTMGSPSYLSPEQARNAPLDGRADIYSLGAMAFEMFSGQRPFAADSESDTVQKHLTDPVPRLPAELARYQPLIDRMMAKRPEDRFDDTRMLIDTLRAMRRDVQLTDAQPRPVRSYVMTLDDGADPDAPTLVAGNEPAPRALVAASSGGGTIARMLRAPVSGGPRRRAVAMLGVAAVLVTAAGLWRLGDEGDVSPPPATPTKATPTSPSTTLAASPEVVSPEVSSTDAPVALAPPSVFPPAPEAPEAGAPAAQTSVPAAESPAAAPPAPSVPELLAKARAAMDNMRLTLPQGISALDYYEQALALDPDNAQAREGRREIARRYASLTRGALAKGDRSRARTLLRRGLALNDSDPGLLALRDELEAPAPRDDAEQAQAAEEPSRIARSEDAGDIQGETPRELFMRVKGWFN